MTAFKLCSYIISVSFFSLGVTKNSTKRRDKKKKETIKHVESPPPTVEAQDPRSVQEEPQPVSGKIFYATHYTIQQTFDGQYHVEGPCPSTPPGT